MLRNVLRAPGDRRAAQALRHLTQVGERRADSALRRGAARSGDDRIEQGADRFPAAVHLPVAGHQPGACHACEFYRIAVIVSAAATCACRLAVELATTAVLQRPTALPPVKFRA